MRSEPWDLGPGTVYELRSVGEVDQLSPAQRDLVPARMRELFANAPNALAQLADRCEGSTFAQWLRAAAKSDVTTRVYDLPPDAGMPSVALLTFDFGTYTTPYGSFPWRLAASCKVGAPQQRPPSLAAVWTALGGLYEQYGGSGYLLEPNDVRPLSEMGDEVEHLLAEHEDPVMSRDEARSWTPYFAADGDYLCYGTDGSSRWLGAEWGGSDEARDTGSLVDELFQWWLDKRHFHTTG